MKSSDTCKICWYDLDEKNFVYYRDSPNNTYILSPVCIECTMQLQNKQWDTYINQINNEKCAKALKILIDKGPPINVRDNNLFPCNNKSGEVYDFFYNNKTHSAKLKNSLIGKPRNEYLEKIRQYWLSIKSHNIQNDIHSDK